MSTEVSVVPQSSVLSLFPSAEELKNLKELATTFISSGLLPKSIDKPEKAIVIMLKGKEAGIPPLQALAHIHVIDGKPGMSSELMLSQLYKNIPGFACEFVETTDKVCRLRAKRPGVEWQAFAYSIQEAQGAGLTSKGNWRSYPAAMLRARAISSMARAVGPEALAGIGHTPDELGAEVDASGNVISVPANGEDKASALSAKLGLVVAKPEPVTVVAEVVRSVVTPLVVPKSVGAAAAEMVFEDFEDTIVAKAPTAGNHVVGFKIMSGAKEQLMGKALKDIDSDVLASTRARVLAFVQANPDQLTEVRQAFLDNSGDYLATLPREPGMEG